MHKGMRFIERCGSHGDVVHRRRMSTGACGSLEEDNLHFSTHSLPFSLASIPYHRKTSQIHSENFFSQNVWVPGSQVKLAHRISPTNTYNKVSRETREDHVLKTPC